MLLLLMLLRNQQRLLLRVCHVLLPISIRTLEAVLLCHSKQPAAAAPELAPAS
jgi:hypothetical protein